MSIHMRVLACSCPCRSRSPALAGAATPAAAAPFAFQPIAIQRINLPRTRQVGRLARVHARRPPPPVLLHRREHDRGQHRPGRQRPAVDHRPRRPRRALPHLRAGQRPDLAGRGRDHAVPGWQARLLRLVQSARGPALRRARVPPERGRLPAARAILPVDFSAAEPKVIPPGGPESSSGINTGGAYAAKLAQDGVHVGFSDIRTDSIEMMVVGTLTRAAHRLHGHRPAGDQPGRPRPRRRTRTSTAWSDAGALYEFKTFTHGGADATYVAVRRARRSLNPDVWSVNLPPGSAPA